MRSKSAGGEAGPVRQPAVAGSFYPSNPGELSRSVDEYCASGLGALPPGEHAVIRVIACMVPHAGYIYSGQVAGAVYGAIEIPRRIIFLGPRHYPAGRPMAVFSSGEWLTPLGKANVDAALAGELMRACPLLQSDEAAHRREHSLEVQLPFLQRVRPDFTFVPIVLGTDDWDLLTALGHSIASVIRAQDEPVLLIISSDMNHYEPDDVTRAKDTLAIERLLALDALGLYDTIHRESISMCGYMAAVCALIALNDLGGNDAQLVRYATSGDVNGDRSQVVGYAGMIFR